VVSLARGAVPAGVASLSIQAAIWFTQSLLLLRADGLSENGAFGLASRLSLLVSFLPVALATASVSFIGQQTDAAQAHAMAKRIIKVGICASLVAMALLGSMAAYLNDLFGTGYAEHASTTALMALAGLAVSTNALLGNTAVGMGRVREWVTSDIVLAIAMAVTASLLIPRYGPDGAAITHLLSYGISAGFLAWKLRTNAEAST
jgi:O-antigen/teichoic acid export membrane protein